jgi:hypothetical protein
MKFNLNIFLAIACVFLDKRPPIIYKSKKKEIHHIAKHNPTPNKFQAFNQQQIKLNNNYLSFNKVTLFAKEKQINCGTTTEN